MGDDTALTRAREASAHGRWATAYEQYSLAAARDGLGPVDLADWGLTALLCGRDDEGCDVLASAFDGLVRDGEVARAARCALWACLNLGNRGRVAAIGGWMERGARLAAATPGSVVPGYLAVPHARRAMGEGDAAGALRSYHLASAVATEVGDRDLGALARLGEGHVLVLAGETTAGLAAVDEVMLAVTTGGASALVAGIVYCVVIQLCREALDLRRAREWTYALDGWCDRQPELVPFRGACRIHRSQVLLESDDWDGALAEAESAVEALSHPRQADLGLAWYQKGEVHRLRGDLTAARDAYGAANEAGADPMPGLALVWTALGRAQEAHDALTARLDSPTPSPALLAGAVEAALAAGDVGAARLAAARLAETADGPAGNLCVDALAAGAQGAVLLAEGDPRSALGPLNRAVDAWFELGVPYEVARARVALARARRALGDDVDAALDEDSARAAFRRLGAATDLAGLDDVPSLSPLSPLSPREVEVLRLVARGLTNRAVATSLTLSERTVARHVSNIFVKLDVQSRSAATAWAYDHGIVERSAD
ncbi:MAG: helix-turn-helix transcriptional regulator [Cellulomonas sp.]